MGQIQPPPYILRIFLPSSTVDADVQLSRQGLRVSGVLWLEPFGCCHRRTVEQGSTVLIPCCSSRTPTKLP